MFNLKIPDTLTLIISQIAIVIIGFLSVIVTTRYLTVSARGEFAFAATIASTVHLFSELGASFATIRLVSKYKRQEGSLYTSALVLLFAKLILIIIILLCSWILLSSSQWQFKIDQYFLLVAVANSIPILISGFFFPLLIVYKNLKYYSYVLFLFRLLGFFFIFIALLLGYNDVTIIFLIHLILSCFALAVIGVVISNCLPSIKVPKWSQIIKIQSDGFGIFLSSLVNFSWTNAIFFLIAAYEGYYVLGLFSVVFVLCVHLSLFGNSIGTKAFKEASSDSKLNVLKLARYCRITLLATCLASAVIYILSPFVIRYIFTADYLEGLIYMPALVCWVIAFSGWRVLWLSLTGSGDIYGVAVINILGAVFCIGSLFIILEFYSLSLAIWGQAISSWLCLYFGIQRVRLHSKELKFTDFIIPKINDFYYLVNVVKLMR